MGIAALVVKLLFLALTFVGVTNLWLAVLADTGTALALTGNSLRLLQGTDRSWRGRRSAVRDPGRGGAD